jgi:hypothetical protein
MPALAAMTMLVTAGAGAVAPAAEAGVHHPLWALTTEQVGPPTSDDPCVSSEVTDLEEGGDPFGRPWAGPCHAGFREEVLYTPGRPRVRGVRSPLSMSSADFTRPVSPDRETSSVSLQRLTATH